MKDINEETRNLKLMEIIRRGSDQNHKKVNLDETDKTDMMKTIGMCLLAGGAIGTIGYLGKKAIDNGMSVDTKGKFKTPFGDFEGQLKIGK